MRHVVLLTLALASAPSMGHAAIIGGCKFNTATQQFQGNAVEQANCLLRAVKPRGSGSVAQPMPEWVATKVGQPVELSEQQLDRYLTANRIDPRNLGGPIRKASARNLRYFVIHDTSSPEIAEEEGFPPDLDLPSYRGNRLSEWNGKISKKVHLIISRDGQSRTYRTWGGPRPSPAIKIEQTDYSLAARKHFVHVENVQPRLKPKTTWAWIAPKPGFSAKQEERLALAYIAASMQAGSWLVPAYHFNIDQGLPDGHDDPQSTDLPSWVKRIAAIEAAIKE